MTQKRASAPAYQPTEMDLEIVSKYNVLSEIILPNTVGGPIVKAMNDAVVSCRNTLRTLIAQNGGEYAVLNLAHPEQPPRTNEEMKDVFEQLWREKAALVQLGRVRVDYNSHKRPGKKSKDDFAFSQIAEALELLGKDWVDLDPIRAKTLMTSNEKKEIIGLSRKEANACIREEFDEAVENNRGGANARINQAVGQGRFY